MKTSLTVRILPVLLVLCMILTACGTKECAHANTELQNTRAATCTAEGYTGDLVCRDCGVTIAAGTATAMAAHAWGDWTVTKEATATEAGNQTHTCGVCGTVATEVIPALGADADTVLDSYSELVEAVYETLLGGENGTLSITLGTMGNSVQLDVTVNKENGIYLAWIDYTLAEGTDTEKASVLYRDGAVAVITEDGKLVEITDLDASLEASYADYIALVNKVCEQANSAVEASLAEYKATLQTFIDENGTRIDALMTKLGVEGSAQDLMSAVAAWESVYAMLAEDLGIETNIKGTVDVELPGKQDLLTLLESFTTVTETENGKVYTLDASNLMETVNAYIAALETVCEMTMAEYVYTLFADSITQTNPEITDWATFEAYIRANITGDMTCGTFIDEMITVVEESGVVTMAEVYALIDAYITEQSGNEFDSEAILTEMHSLTLDQFIAAMYDDETMTLTAFFDEVSETLTTMLVGDLVVFTSSNANQDEETKPTPDSETTDKNDQSAPAEPVSEDKTEDKPTTDEPTTDEPTADEITVTLAQVIAMAKSYAEMFAIDALGFSLSVDAEGNLVAFLAQTNISMVMEGEKSPLVDFKLDIKKDPNAKVTVPENLNAVISNRVNAYYDANGNLVIKGLNNKVEYGFELNAPYKDFPIADIVARDEQASANYGFDVYATKEAYWQDKGYSMQYLVGKDGSYALFSYTFDNSGNLNLVIKGKLTEQVVIPEKAETSTGSIHYSVYDASGNDVTASYESILQIDILLPTYFVCVDGRYIELSGLHSESGFEELGLETMKLSSGSTMYIKGRMEQEEYTYVYGYLPVAENYCVWVACQYQNGNLVNELYHEEYASLAIQLSNIYDVNDYLTQNTDGSYIVSVNLFNELNTLVTEDYDGYSVSINGVYTEGDVEYSYFYTVGAVNILGENLPGFGGESAERGFDWDHWFNN